MGAGSPGAREFPAAQQAAFAVHHPHHLPARAEGMAGGKKAELAVQSTRANAEQCKGNALKAVFKLKTRGVEGESLKLLSSSLT